MVEVKLHDIGEGMTEGEVIHIFVKPGDTVKIDEPLVEVQTDKMTAELPSPAAGKIENISVKLGDVIEVGTTMMEIDAGDGVKKSEDNTKDKPAEKKAAAEAESSQPPQETAAPKGPKRILASPHTRKLARELEINIEEVSGSGRLGRITDEDLHTFKEQPADGDDHQEPASRAPEPAGSVKEVPFRGRRKVIADKMSRSLFTIPHVTHFDEADVTELLALKKRLKAMEAKAMDGAFYNVSMSAFFIKAIALALNSFPIFNSTLDEDAGLIRMHEDVNMGMATDTEEGLIVPVIHQADRKSLKTIHTEMKELMAKAKAGKLRSNELSGSTFTISNVGPMGSTGATPIINYPEAGLMAFHKTKKMPVVTDDDEIVIRSMMNISMSFDHRVADGGQAVAFTNQVIRYLEQPELIFVELT